MSNLSHLGASAVAKARFQGIAMPSNLYFALAQINRGVFVPGAIYASGDYVIASTWNNRVYKCTTAGTAGGTEPTWPTTDAGTVTSGGVVFTEQTTALAMGTFTEANYGGYTRATVAANSTNFSENGAGVISNLVAITYGTSPTTSQTVAVILEMSASSGGSVLSVAPMGNPQVANVGAGAVSTPIGQFNATVA